MKRITLMFFFFFLSMAGFSQGLPLEGFENPWTPSGPVGWGVYQNELSTLVKWRQTIPGNSGEEFKSGAYAAFVARQNVSEGSLAKDWLVSPAFTLPQNPQLRFWSRLILPQNNGGVYKILIAPAGSDLSDLASYTVVQTWQEPDLSPTPTTYTEKLVDLPANLPGQVHIAFLMEADNGDSWMIDDVTVVQQCLVPTLQTTVAGHNSATINWANPQSTNQWEIEVVKNTEAFTGVGATYDGVPPYTAPGLDPLTAYKFKVRAVCGTNNKSDWSAVGTFTTLATPPVNDNCANAIALTVNPTNLCTTSTSGTVRGATASPEASTCNGTDDDDVWFQFVATNTSHMINLTNVTGGAVDMYMAIYTGSDCTSLVQKMCTDNDSDTVTGLTIGQTYKIRVYTYTSTAGQNTTFDICVATPVTSQANDECANATVLPVNPDLNCGQTVAASVMGATASAEANTCNGTDDDDVWFEFTATNAIHTISLNNRGGSNTDLMHVLYSGNSCGALTQIYCSDPESSIATGLTPGQTYKVRVYTYSPTAGQTSTFNICIGTPPPPPSNDNCATPTVVPVNPDLACAQTVPGTVGWSTASPEGGTTCSGTEDDDVWFEFTATNAIHTINLNNVTGTDTNLNHVLYSGTCGALTQIYCSDPNNSVATGLTVGQTYKIRVYSNGTTVGLNTTYNLCIGTPPPPPVNDNCATATAVPVNPTLTCAQTVAGTVAWSTHSTEGNTCNTGRDDDDVWYEFVATSATHIITLSDVVGSDTDLYHVLYAGNQCGTLTQLYCSDPNSSTATGLTIGQTYKIRVYTWSNSGAQTTTFNICVGTPPPPPPPPANDNCAAATVVGVNPALTCTVTAPGTLVGATASAEANTCGGTDDDDVWYQFVATNAVHTISLNNRAGSTTDLFHVLYAGDQCGSLTQLYCSDDEASIATGLTIGQTYKVRVYSWTSTLNQTSTFDICIGTPPPPPVNDNCATATVVPVNPTLACAQVTHGTIAWATPSPEANTCSGTDDDDVWYEFVATYPIHTISLNNITGSTTDLFHVLYSGNQCGSLTQLYCSDNESSIATNLVVGQTYKIRVYSYTSTGGQTSQFDLCVGTPPAPPANDECTAAVTVPVNADLNCGQVTPGTISWATPSSQSNTCGNTNDDDDVWFQFTATNAIQVINLTNVAGSTTDLYHVVYSGDQCGALTQVYCSDANLSVGNNFVVGQTYKIRVYSNTATAGQTTTFNVCVGTPPPPPANDDCAAAIVAPVNSSNYCVDTISGTITSATASPEANTCAGTDDDDVWYQFVATSTTHYIKLLNVSGTTTDLMHVLYEGDQCGTLIQKYCSDPETSTATGLTVGQTYKIRVYSYTANLLQNVTFDLCISTPATSQPNDNCANAIVAPVNEDSLCGATTLGSIQGATASTEANACTGTADDDVWYEFTATHTQHYVALLDESGNRLSTDALNHAVYSGDCGALTQVVCSDPNNSLLNNLVIGQTYKVRVYSSANTPQAFIFRLCIGVMLTCADSQPFCANNETQGVSFPGSVGVPSLGDVSCLNTTPNPTFYFLQIGQSGDLSLNISQTSSLGQPIDVDFIAYGPFADITAACVDLFNANEVDCSYSPAAVEPFSIPGAVAGEYYMVMITNFNGARGTINFSQLNINDPDAGATDCSIVCTADLGEDQVICGSDNNEYLLDSGIINAATYVWKLDGDVIPGANTQTYTATQSGNYSVEITKASCNTNPTDDVNITFLPVIDIADQAVALCGDNGESQIDLTTLTAGILGTLSPDDFTVTYHLTETAATAGNNPIDTATVFETTSQTIYVRVENATIDNCFDVAPIVITVNTAADATIVYAGSPYCSDAANATVTLTGNVGGEYTSTTGLVINIATGAIDVAASEPGIYTVTYTIAATASCDEFKTTTQVTILEKPEADFAYSAATFCLNGEVAMPIFTGTATAGTFTVDHAGLTIDAATGAINPATSTPGTYVITNTVDAVAPCAGDTATFTIVIIAAPIGTFTYADAAYCQNGINNPSPVLDGAAGNFTATPEGLSINSTTGVIDLSNSAPGVYVVSNTVNGTDDCPQVTETTTVTIIETANIAVAEDCVGNDYTLTAVFNNEAYNEDNVSFAWTNASGFTLGNGPSLVIEDKGIYYLTVTPLNTIDCPVTVEVAVEASGCLIPKGISPNGDGKNDEFDLTSFNVAKLSIFNRYGREVYSKTEYTNEWHGQTDGDNELPTGTYYYMIERSNGETNTGWVYINRQEK